jgi:hypothetical protein
VRASEEKVGPGRTWRLLLVLAFLDALLWSALWLAQPARLFDWMGLEPRGDTWAWQLRFPTGEPPAGIAVPRDAGLWHLLAFVNLGQAGFLALAAWRPRSLGGLVAAPLIGHALGAALWLWALGSTYTFPPERAPFPARGPLVALAAHDAVWVALLLLFLLVRQRIAGWH